MAKRNDKTNTTAAKEDTMDNLATAIMVDYNRDTGCYQMIGAAEEEPWGEVIDGATVEDFGPLTGWGEWERVYEVSREETLHGETYRERRRYFVREATTNATETEQETGQRIGRAIARDVLAEDMPHEWTGLDAQDVDEIPEGMDHAAVELAARETYEAIIRADLATAEGRKA